MKTCIKNIHLAVALLMLSSVIWPMSAAKAATFPQVQKPADFIAMGDGKCVYYYGGGCTYGGWYANPKSNCSWEPCCATQMAGYTSWDYQFQKTCDVGSFSWGVGQESLDKTKCLNPNFDCCCSTAPPADTTASSITPPKKPVFVMPQFQIPIDTVKLSQENCVLDANNKYQCSVPWIGEYIVGIYNYGLSVAGILAAIMLMAGGVMWLVSSGDASKVAQAKELITGAITGLVILSSSYILLTQINPALTTFRSISLGVISPDVTPTPANSTDFSANCVPQTSGDCAVSNMSQFGDKASQASAICHAESGGNAGIFNSLTKCTGGEYAVWGLFQFNLSANNFTDEKGNVLACYKAFDKPWTNKSPNCTVTDSDLYNKCVTAAKNPALSIKNAYILSSGAGNWGPWEANAKWCHF